MQKDWHELIHLLVNIEKDFERVKELVGKLALKDEEKV